MSNENEVWAVFPEFPGYSASNLGRVRNDITGRILCNHLTYGKKLPYYRIRLSSKDRVRTLGVHYMVLASFVPKPEGEWVCDHINHNSLDNRLENLRWVSVRDNTMNSDSRSFLCFKDGEYLTTFAGWVEAGKALDVDPEYLRNCMRNKSGNYNGYVIMSVKKHHKRYHYNHFLIID